MGKAVNTKRMKSTWKKWTRENYAKWKVTKCKWGGGRPGFAPRALSGIVLSAHGALFSGIMQQPPKTSPASEPGGGPLDNSAQVYEFG